MDSTVNQVLNSFELVSNNLEKITLKQLYISKNVQGNGIVKDKQKVNSEIIAINKLWQDNKLLIDNINNNISVKNNHKQQWTKIIELLTAQLAGKGMELKQMSERLNNKDKEIKDLKWSLYSTELNNEVYTELVNANEKELNAGHYIIGKSKDLEKKNLIERKGGILGFRKLNKLNSNFDETSFTTIDISVVKTIEINQKKCTIITSHPGDSYIFEFDEKDKRIVKKLVITNYRKFWKASKYLVITYE